MSRTRTAVIAAVTTIAVLASTGGQASAAAGDLDARFSGDGSTYLPGDGAVDVGVQSTGKIVVLGTKIVGPESTEATLTRLRPNGQVDRSFGTDGTLSYLVNGAGVQPTALAVQPDDAIIVVGSSGEADAFRITITRITPSGAIDTGFGLGGHRVVTRGVNSQATDVALDDDGRVVVSAWNNGGTTNTPLMIRLLPDGSRDVSFDNDGLLPLPHPGSSVAYAKELDITPNGRYVMGVEVVKGLGVIETSVMRVRPNGRVDTSFGSNGYRRIVLPGWPQIAPSGLEVDTDGRTVVLAVVGSELQDPLAVLAVLTPSGALDTSFDDDGRMVVPIIGGIAVSGTPFTDLEVQADGRILVGQSIFAEGGFQDASLVRLRPNGRLDRSFSGDGVVVFDFLWEGASYLTAIAQSPTNGRVYAVGTVTDYMGFEGSTPGVVAIRSR